MMGLMSTRYRKVPAGASSRLHFEKALRIYLFFLFVHEVVKLKHSNLEICDHSAKLSSCTRRQVTSFRV